MDYVTLAAHAVRQYAPDQIFAASQRAKADIAALGEDAVINATLGECLGDDGRLMVLPTVERMIRQMPVEDICSYAPIAGVKGFNEAVQVSLFGGPSDRFHVEAVATPGGCGALRHAIWNFLDDGDAMLTTNWIWGPYKNICEEHGRRMVTFDMFTPENTFSLENMDRAIGEVLAGQNQLLLILNTPANNPTGYSMTRPEMEQTVAILKKHAAGNPGKNLTLCLDVSYIDFDAGFEESREMFDAISDMPANTMALVIFSMSKSYTMCGMRCGALVCLGSTEEAAAAFKQAMTYSSRSTWSNVIHMAQKILVDINLNPEVREQVNRERDVFRETITARGLAFRDAAERAGLDICPYKHGYFTAIPCGRPGRAAQLLADQHIYVVPQARGLRFSPCAVTEEKCRKAPAFIKAAIDRADHE